MNDVKKAYKNLAMAIAHIGFVRGRLSGELFSVSSSLGEIGELEYAIALLGETMCYFQEQYGEQLDDVWCDQNPKGGNGSWATIFFDTEDPANVCLECEDCGVVLLDAELYTLCPRTDTEG